MFFGKDFARRLATIADSAHLIVGGLPLPHKVSGSDEIAELDDTLHQSAARLSEYRQKELSYVQNAGDVICTLDHEMRFVWVNAACVKLWWMMPEELIGRSLMDLVSKESRENTDAVFDAAADGH